MIEKLRPFITKQTAKFRTPIPAEERLAITLRYLATGEAYESVMYQFRIHRTTISQIIQEVCSVIYKVLSPDYMKLPFSPQEWKAIADEGYRRWNFPNCFGAADGKQIAILKPKHSGSDIYNYKGFYSVVLLAFVDYDYRFLAADVGVRGRISDGSVFKNFAMYFASENNKLNLYDSCRLPLTENDESDPHSSSVSFVFVADDPFQLTSYYMKPYGRKIMTDVQRIIYYRLSRKRRVTENAFGILVNRFRVFSVRNNLNENNVLIVVLASHSLHNLLRERSRDTYAPPGFTDEIQMDGNI